MEMYFKEKLKKSCMAFELKNGEILFIDDDDIKQIAEKIMDAHLLEGKMYLFNNHAKEKATKLYEVFQKEKEHMSKELKSSYLKKILDICSSEDLELTTLRNEIDRTKSEIDKTNGKK